MQDKMYGSTSKSYPWMLQEMLWAYHYQCGACP